ncbi:uncharacterized protein BO80DRAFT_373741 [Aspergillus ibericus CBS 121593]|uniref:Uncharacterized protein n=1 Tax=Aspergillus ibericus CBS 121593 TaxID=1448316 RepID=A0A395HAH2_9EURO|nr:hypothetical protein BO80DRAFT_373741 [Aspergillus ibericus CBS 121593]RAL04503.1 hypothetical protein BO80DRAFT_373741 [Aspergillus ibericus CBS 121593]
MPWNHSRPRTTAPRERRRWRNNGKPLQRATGNIPSQRPDEDIKRHLPRRILKDGRPIFAIVMDPRSHKPRDKPAIPSEPANIEVHCLTPQKEPVGKVRGSPGLRHGFQHTEEREILTDSVHTMLHPDAAYDKFYSVTFLKPDNSPLLRCMTVDFETDVCAMHYEVWEELKLPIERYEGPPISIVDHKKQMVPLGKAQATWSRPDEDKLYSAEFYVVRGLEFDACLGISTVRKLGLYRRDPALASRLRAADQANVNHSHAS